MLIWRNWQRFVVLIAICVSGCTPLDVTAALGISEMTTGWLDVGLDDLGRNKLVPTISFSLTNRSSQRVRTLQLNGVFRRCAVLYGDEQPDTVSPADAEGRDVRRRSSGMGKCARTCCRSGWGRAGRKYWAVHNAIGTWLYRRTTA